MATHKTLSGRARNSTIPRAIVEKRKDIFIAELHNGADDMFRRMGAETDQVDVLIEDPLIHAGIMRDIVAANFTFEFFLCGKATHVTIEARKDNTFRVTRLKKTPPALPPARGFGVPPPKKR